MSVGPFAVLGRRIEDESRTASLLVALKTVVGTLDEHIKPCMRIVEIASTLERSARIPCACTTKDSTHGPSCLDGQDSCRQDKKKNQ